MRFQVGDVITVGEGTHKWRILKLIDNTHYHLEINMDSRGEWTNIGNGWSEETLTHFYLAQDGLERILEKL